jgi:cysteine-rich repeat protein
MAVTRRSAILAVWLGSACVGSPPAPPLDDGTASEGSDSLTGTTASLPEPTTANDGTGSGSEDTGPTDATCGDAIVEPPEECDIGELNGTGMYCTSECRSNDCGDGYVGPGEACDDGNDSNEDLCTTECGPTSCGDGVMQGAEECDEGSSNAPSAPCLPSCVEASCGDTFILEGVEACDGNEVGGATCESQGYGGGVLLCADDCLSFDVSSCEQCGNGVLEPGEQCEASDLNGETCVSQGFVGGTLGCTSSCTLDTSSCVACGNGVADFGEDCDGADLDGETCATLLGADYGGTLACNQMACSFDTASCCVNLSGPCTSDSECCSGVCGNMMADVCVP